MAMSKEEAARRKKERRDRREQRALDAGLNKTEARALRDRSDKRVDQEIREFILKNKRPPVNPSDLTKKEREKYIPLSNKGEGYVIGGWRDKTEDHTGEDFLELKRDFRGDSEPAILTQVYGNSKTGAPGYIDQHGVGYFGVIETQITKTKESAEAAAKNLKAQGYTIFYLGKATRRMDMLAIIGALSLGVYSKDEKRTMIYHWIKQVQKVNPGTGKYLLDDWRNYYGKGY